MSKYSVNKNYLYGALDNISQFVWYAPYGEALIDEHVGSYENPYKFSGKELDENTGLYDHGARHREPSSGVWYGVDALFEKYSEISPYSYCGGNPVRFVDMDGREVTDALERQIVVYENVINDKIEHLETSKKRRWTDKKIQKLKDIKAELVALKKSKKVLYDYQEYRMNSGMGEKDSRGYVSYDQENNTVIVNINTFSDFGTESSHLGAFAHELKHAYQYEICEFSFEKVNDGKVITKFGGFLYDYQDEVEAHNRGQEFGGIGNPERLYYGNLKDSSEPMTKERFNQYIFKITTDPNGVIKENYFNYPTE